MFFFVHLWQKTPNEVIIISWGQSHNECLKQNKKKISDWDLIFQLKYHVLEGWIRPWFFFLLRQIALSQNYFTRLAIKWFRVFFSVFSMALDHSICWQAKKENQITMTITLFFSRASLFPQFQLHIYFMWAFLLSA